MKLHLLSRTWKVFYDDAEVHTLIMLFERLTLTVDWQKCERSIMRKGDKKKFLLWKDAYET